MQNAALAELGLAPEWRYLRLPIPPEAFAETVAALPAHGFAGINVTIPHKEAALALASDATPAARAIGAANTLSFDPASGAIHADNTDAPVVDAFVARLAADLESGAWRRRHAHLLERDALDCGYRLLVAELG